MNVGESWIAAKFQGSQECSTCGYFWNPEKLNATPVSGVIRRNDQGFGPGAV